jgi:hypothetical protein
MSCMYACLHTWRPIMGMLIILLGFIYVLRLLYAIRCFRVMAYLWFWLCWWLYKRPNSSFLLLIFLESLVMESFFHSQTGFLDAHDSYYMAIVYTHYVFFPSFQFNSKKIALCHLMLKATNFSWLWVSCVLELLLLFFLFILLYCNYNRNNNNHNW